MFTSSISVYGSGQVPMLETMVPEPEYPYGIAKYAVEMDLKSAHEMFGLNYVIFRPHPPPSAPIMFMENFRILVTAIVMWWVYL